MQKSRYIKTPEEIQGFLLFVEIMYESWNKLKLRVLEMFAVQHSIINRKLIN